MNIALVFLGSTGACSIYSFQMAQALLQRGDCTLTLFISKRVYNLSEWRHLARNPKCKIVEIETYSHNRLSVALSFLNICRIYKFSRQILLDNPDVVYFPFGCVWGIVLFHLLKNKACLVNTIHDPHPHDKIKNPFLLLFDKLTNLAQNAMSGFVILNTNDYEFVFNKFNKPICVIPHAAFTYYAKDVDCQMSKGLKKTISFIGRIEPYKGLDLLVSAFESLSIQDLKLVIAGGGEIEPSLKAKILANDHIVLNNRFIPDDEMISIVCNSDFVVLPYKRASQSGVIPMCFALGKTVVTTNVGSLSLQVPRGTGVITEPSVTDIANAISYFYENVSMIELYSKNAQKYADTELSWSKSSQLLIDFFRSLLSRDL